MLEGGTMLAYHISQSTTPAFSHGRASSLVCVQSPVLNIIALNMTSLQFKVVLMRMLQGRLDKYDQLIRIDAYVQCLRHVTKQCVVGVLVVWSLAFLVVSLLRLPHLSVHLFVSLLLQTMHLSCTYYLSTTVSLFLRHSTQVFCVSCMPGSASFKLQ